MNKKSLLGAMVAAATAVTTSMSHAGSPADTAYLAQAFSLMATLKSATNQRIQSCLAAALNVQTGEEFPRLDNLRCARTNGQWALPNPFGKSDKDFLECFLEITSDAPSLSGFRKINFIGTAAQQTSLPIPPRTIIDVVPLTVSFPKNEGKEIERVKRTFEAFCYGIQFLRAMPVYTPR